MIRAGIVSTHHERPAGVADRFQLCGERVIAESSQARAVLKASPNRSDFVDETDGFPEQAGSVSVDALPLGVGRRNVLARRGADDDGGQVPKVRNKSSRSEFLNISVHLTTWMIGSEDGVAPWVYLAGCDGAVTRAGHTQAPAAGCSGKQVQHGITMHAHLLG